MLLQISVREIHIDMLKIYDTRFSMAYDEKGLVRICNSYIWLIIPPVLQNMTQNYQIMCGYEKCIKGGTYQELLNHWRKWRLKYITNYDNSLTGVPVEQLNTENIFSRYSDVVLTDEEPIHSRSKDAVFSILCDFSDKDIKLSKVVMCVKLFQWLSWFFCYWCRK